MSSVPVSVTIQFDPHLLSGPSLLLTHTVKARWDVKTAGAVIFLINTGHTGSIHNNFVNFGLFPLLSPILKYFDNISKKIRLE